MEENNNYHLRRVVTETLAVAVPLSPLRALLVGGAGDGKLTKADDGGGMGATLPTSCCC